MRSSPPIERLVASFKRLPGIGEKSATRLAFFVLGMPDATVQELADAISRLKHEIVLCEECFDLTHETPCEICRDEKRDPGKICVVEEPADLASIERSGSFDGRYFVLGGALSQWPLGYLSDRIGRRKILIFAAVIGVGISVVIVSAIGSLTVVSANIAGLLWGAIAFPLYAIAVAHANDFAEADDYVMISSGLLLMYGIGAIVGPFAASTIMTWTNAAGLYAYTGIVHLSLAAFVVYRMVRRESAPDETHMAFGDALATAHTASQVYEEEIQHLAEEED